MSIYKYIYIYIYNTYIPGALGGLKKVSDISEMELQVVVSTM